MLVLGMKLLRVMMESRGCTFF
jgi:hypothetical protein